MYKCDICLKNFGRRDNMLRHKKSAHPDEDLEEDAMSEVSVEEDIFGPVKENSNDSSDENMSVTSENSVDIDPWQDIVDETFAECQSQFESEVSELMEDDTDISEEDAREIVYKDMKNTYRKAMMDIFGTKMLWFNALKKDPIYKAVKKTVSQLIDTEDYQADEALKYATLKRRFLFDKILSDYEIPQLKEGEDGEQETDSE